MHRLLLPMVEDLPGNLAISDNDFNDAVFNFTFSD